MSQRVTVTSSAPEFSPWLITTCAWLCLLAAAALPLVVTWSWRVSDLPSYWAPDIGGPPADHLRPLGAALAVIPSLLLARGLFLANACLRRFGRGEFLTQAAVGDLKGFARWSFFAAGAGLLAPTVIGLVFTILNTAGPKELTFRIGAQELVGLPLSGIFWIIAGVLAHAVQVADENRQFI